jgi:rhamnosyltransferase
MLKPHPTILSDRVPLATVIIRTKNSQDTLAQALDGLFSQTCTDFETLVVDSGSTDGTLSIVERYPCSLIRIRPEEYFPGPVLNRAVAATRTPLVVFQNSDVVPLGVHTLERLLRPILEGGKHASFARQIPRPEASTWVRRDYERAFPAHGPAPSWLPYSLPLAAMLRSAWEQLPFYDDAWGSEDTEWGSRAKREGMAVEYVPAATVMHSHNYTLRQIYGRRFIEGEADAFIFRQRLSLLQAIRGVGGSIWSDVGAHLRARDFLGRGVYHWAYLKGRRLGEQRLVLNDRNAATGQKVVLDRYHG